jgi:hypothetical protein
VEGDDDGPLGEYEDDEENAEEGTYAYDDGPLEGNKDDDADNGGGFEGDASSADDNDGIIFDDVDDGAVSTSSLSLLSDLRPAIGAFGLSLFGALVYLCHQCFCAETLIPNDPNFSSGPKPGRETELARFDRMSTMSTAYGAKRPLYEKVVEGDEKKQSRKFRWSGTKKSSYEKVDEEAVSGLEDDWPEDDIGMS